MRVSYVNSRPAGRLRRIIRRYAPDGRDAPGVVGCQERAILPGRMYVSRLADFVLVYVFDGL